MIQSMTGFATKTLVLTTPDNNKSSVTLSLKSLNSRYFEAICKLPHALSHLETDTIKLFKKKLLRGHLYFTIYMSNPNISKGSIEPASNVIRGYFNAINTIKNSFSIDQTILLDHILGLPNIFSIEEKNIDKDSTQIILNAINELIEQVIIARNAEGAALQTDLNERITIMTKEITHVEKLSHASIEKQKLKVNQALQELGDDESLMADSRKNALYGVLDKIDIHEEIIRFKSHLHNLKSLLEAPGLEKGKRLDFTLQELAREINTVAAKCSDADISSRAINIKVEIEKTREQAQNIV